MRSYSRFLVKYNINVTPKALVGGPLSLVPVIRSGRGRFIIFANHLIDSRELEMATNNELQRSVLALRNMPRIGFTTCDAKDPETKLAPPESYTR